MGELIPVCHNGVSSGGEPPTNSSADPYPTAYRHKRMGNQRLEPISEIEDLLVPLEGFGVWSEYTDPTGRWLPKAAKAGAFTATTVVSGFLFVFALGAVTPTTTLIAGLAVLALLVAIHEELHGLVAYLMSAEVSFASGRYGGFPTLSRHAIQGA